MYSNDTHAFLNTLSCSRDTSLTNRNANLLQIQISFPYSDFVQYTLTLRGKTMHMKVVDVNEVYLYGFLCACWAAFEETSARFEQRVKCELHWTDADTPNARFRRNSLTTFGDETSRPINLAVARIMFCTLYERDGHETCRRSSGTGDWTTKTMKKPLTPFQESSIQEKCFYVHIIS